MALFSILLKNGECSYIPHDMMRLTILLCAVVATMASFPISATEAERLWPPAYGGRADLCIKTNARLMMANYDGIFLAGDIHGQMCDEYESCSPDYAKNMPGTGECRNIYFCWPKFRRDPSGDESGESGEPGEPGEDDGYDYDYGYTNASTDADYSYDYVEMATV